MDTQINVKIVNIAPHKFRPSVYAEVVQVDTGKFVFSGELSSIFLILEMDNKKTYKCVNMSKDRFDFPCVTDKV